MATRVTKDYVETISPMGYVSNREITNLEGHFLVKGSINTRIVNQEKVVNGKRYILKGQAKTVNSGINGSADWKTNTGEYRNLRSYMNGQAEIEVLIGETWTRLKRGYKTSNFRWAPIWSDTELQDLLIGVRGDDKLYMWSGGLAKVASVTANTITKQGIVTGTDISFISGTRSLDKASGGLTVAGFYAGQKITIVGTVSNDGNYTIESVTDDTMTFIDTDVITTESAGSSFTIKDTMSGTWAEARFLAVTSPRSITIAGVEYTYTGGEDTGTLTGLTVSPVANGVVAGDTVVQSILEYSPTALADRKNNLVGVNLNHLFVGSETSRTVLISKNTDYLDYSYTSPLRVPGEGFLLTLDSCPTGFVSSENEMIIYAGDDDIYNIKMEYTSDGLGENVVITKLKTASGQSAVSQEAIAPIKNSVAVFSKERVVDTLGSVENVASVQNTPISDDIRDDLEAYDITGVDMRYFRRSLFIALPAEGLLLEYDLRFGYWQPPQQFPISKLAIIDDKLCGHSSVSNETYVLYEGYNDLGAPVKAVAAFGYENFGSRFSLKTFDEIAREVYLSRNTILKDRILYDYMGSTDIREFEIDGDDPSTTFVPTVYAGLGANPLGHAPLGGSLTEIPMLVKSRSVSTTNLLDFFERQRVFEAEGVDIRFEILAFGENVRESDNEASFIKK